MSEKENEAMSQDEEVLAKAVEESTDTVGACQKPEVQVYFQYSGTELAANAIVEQVENIWKDTKKEPIESVDLYIKPEEMAAYYVINEEFTGKIDL